MVTPVTPGTASASARPSTAAEHAGLRHREHEHSRRPRAGLAAGRDRCAQGVGQDELFQALAAGKLECARAQAADRACRQFQHGGPGSGDAQFGVHRAGPQAERAGGVPGDPDRVGETCRRPAGTG